MDRSVSLVLVLPLCFLLIWCSDGVQGKNEAPGAKVILTKFEITDTTLDLGFQIRNGSNHDVWICHDIAGNLRTHFEAYLAKDEQTFLIRRRFDIATTYQFNEPPIGVYVRLGPGEERPESLSFALPVEARLVFAEDKELGLGEYATRLVLEIGFYDEDLPGLIRGILTEADKFTGEITLDNPYIIERYFPGLLVKRYFGSLSSFDQWHTETSKGRLAICYMRDYRLGEQVLHLEVNGLHIPYKVPDWLMLPGDNPACETVLASDLNGDCKVDFADFKIMAFHWLEDHTE